MGSATWSQVSKLKDLILKPGVGVSVCKPGALQFTVTFSYTRSSGAALDYMKLDLVGQLSV